jgi:signal transduction histidine kinase
LSLLVTGLGGWFLARHSLSPVVVMADRARKIGVENLHERLPIADARDELGRLAGTFNELLARLEASVEQQRQFMADASHELRTPVNIARTAASVALQQPTRTDARLGALARWIANVHGGEIRLAASSRVGSTFVVVLPVTE